MRRRIAGITRAAALTLGLAIMLVAGTTSATSATPPGSSSTTHARSSTTTSSGTSQVESSTPLLELLGQSSEVTPAAPTFFVNVRVGKGAPPGAQLSLTVYDAVQNRSDFEKTLAGSLTRELQPLPAVAVSGLAPLAGGGARYVAAVVTQSSTANQTGPVINLPYDSVTKGYAGVYPVVVALESATGSTLSKFTTYLTFAE